MYFPPLHLFDIILAGTFLLVSLGFVYVRRERYMKVHDTVTNYTTNRTARIIRLISLILSISLLGIIILKPTGLMGNPSQSTKGIDCIWLLDTSMSMDVTDMKSGDDSVSRLSQAKSLIEDYIVAHGENRYWLVIFAWKARLVSPLTTEHDSLLSFLTSIDSKSIHDGGSDFHEALQVATERFGTGNENPEAIVLLSDGGDLEDAPDSSSLKQLFQWKQTTLITVGLGQTKPSPIPIGTSPFGDIVYKRFGWETVLSGLNRNTLKALADIGKWSYIEGTKRADLEKALSRIPSSMLWASSDTASDITIRVLAGLSVFFFLVFLLLPSSFLVRWNVS